MHKASMRNAMIQPAMHKRLPQYPVACSFFHNLLAKDCSQICSWSYVSSGVMVMPSCKNGRCVSAQYQFSEQSGCDINSADKCRGANDIAVEKLRIVPQSQGA
jgi:hypothetical protein